MKCHHCDNQATVHLTQILNGQCTRWFGKRAQAKGVTNPENLSIGGLMEKVDLEVIQPTHQWCVRVAVRLTKTLKRRRLGCDACYHVFRPILDPLLDGMHAGTKHLGKVPLAPNQGSIRAKI